MSRAKNVKEEVAKDPRIEALETIWWGAVAMLAICIPLCSVLRGPAMAYAVVVGAAAASIGVWATGARKRRVAEVAKESELEKENERLKSKLEEMEERLGNVETMSRFEMRLAAEEEIAKRRRNGSVIE